MGAVQKVVIDTNVFISAFGWGGKPLSIMELLEQGKIRNCLSGAILKELITAISYPKLAFSHTTQTGILEFVLAWSDIYDPAERISAAPDSEDNKFIECASAAHSRIIITGDKRFLSIRRHRDIRIVSPEEFLARAKKN